MRAGRFIGIVLAATGPAAAAVPAADPTPRERFEAERTAKARELAVAERAQLVSEGDLALRRKTAGNEAWRSPLVLAIIAAAIAALGNAIVAALNGRQQRALESERAAANRTLEREKAEAQVALEREKAAAQRALDEQQAESNRILEVIKTGGNPDAAADNMDFLVKAGLVTGPALVAKLSTFLDKRAPGAGPALPSVDGVFKFQSSAGMTPQVEATLAENLAGFLRYLDQVGFPRTATAINIEVDPLLDNAHYLPDRQTVVLGRKFRDDPDVPRREYMHHVLGVTNAKWRDEPPSSGIESGLADYFPCSYTNRPVIGEVSAAALGLAAPFIRSLTLDSGFGDMPADIHDRHTAGNIWGSMFWELRTDLGQTAADLLLRQAWSSARWPRGFDRANRSFVGTLLAEASDGDARQFVRSVLERRGYPLPDPVKRAATPPAPPPAARSAPGRASS